VLAWSNNKPDPRMRQSTTDNLCLTSPYRHKRAQYTLTLFVEDLARVLSGQSNVSWDVAKHLNDERHMICRDIAGQ